MLPTQQKNISDYRDILSEQIDLLRKGKTTPANINAITNATGKVFSSVKLQMEYAKMTGLKPDIQFLKQLEEKSETTKKISKKLEEAGFEKK